MRISARLAAVSALGLLAMAVAMAQTTAITFQGRLTDVSVPASGTYDLRFRLMDALVGGSQIGGEIVFNDITLPDGYFTRQLDWGVSAFNGGFRFIEISVRPGPSAGAYTVLTPRTAVTSTPYAIMARTVSDNSITAAKIVDGQVSLAKISNFGSAPGQAVSTFGGIPVWGYPTAGSLAIPIEATGPAGASGAALTVRSEGATVGILGRSADAPPSAGFHAGVMGVSGTGSGLVGYSTAGLGIYALSDGLEAGWIRNLGSGHDVTLATDNFGLRGRHTNGNYAILGLSNDGIRAWHLSGNSAGSALYGESTIANGNGVIGIANTGTSAYGVYGGSSAGFAGYFNGKVFVSGTLSKGGGSFKIDHPLDPENKYLYHSFVESPDMMNLYNGNVTTDARGEAWVTMPEWFDTLNRDFRYQLTVLDEGDDFVLAKVAKKMENRRFLIKTSRPNVEVSWMVSGIRQDRWANANRIPVEEEKPEEERGRYLHPELYGAPAEASVTKPIGRSAETESK